MHNVSGRFAIPKLVGDTAGVVTERFRRVMQVWNWLPAFRGVAEHESIHRAAAALAISPSALSRTVKLLEDALGLALFLRQPGGALRLTAHGERLLLATRDAMRLVDDGLDAGISEAAFALGIGVSNATLAVLVARSLPVSAETRVRVSIVAESAIEDALLQGAVDVVLGHEPAKGSESLDVERLGALSFGVYVAKSDDALAERRRVVTATERAESLPDHVGSVAVVVDGPEAVAHLSARGNLAGELPDAFAPYDGLRRAGDGGPNSPVVAHLRKPVLGGGQAASVQTLLLALRQHLAR